MIIYDVYLSWLALAALPVVVAQGSFANCTDIVNFRWVFNSKGQSPCEVVQDLSTTCEPNGFTLQPLTSGSYPGPSVGQTNNCHCSSIFYSLISACGACQDGNWITWQQYLQNCTGPIFLTVYSGKIPPDTSVPHWAYLNVTATNNTFDPSVASRAGGRESTAPGTSGSSSQSISPGVIAGAVVGSVLGTLIIVGGILYLLDQRRKALRRGKRMQPETSEQGTFRSSPPPLTSTTVSPQPTMTAPFYSREPPPPSSFMRYDPDNPATFPSMPMYHNGGSRADLGQLQYPGLAEPS